MLATAAVAAKVAAPHIGAALIAGGKGIAATAVAYKAGQYANRQAAAMVNTAEEGWEAFRTARHEAEKVEAKTQARKTA